MAFALSILAVSSAYSARLDASNVTPPAIELDSPYNSATTTSTSIEFVFTYNKKGTQVAESACALYVDGSLAQNFKATTLVPKRINVSGLERKKHTWQVFCYQSQSDLWGFEIIPLPPPKVTLGSPQNSYSSANGTLFFSFTYDSGSDELASSACNLFINQILKQSANATSGQRASISPLEFSAGTYVWGIQCARPAGSIFQPVNSESRVFQIKALPKPKAVPNITQNVTNATPPLPPNKPRIASPSSWDAGLPMQLVALDGWSNPYAGIEITVHAPGGATEKTPQTDALGRAVFTPQKTGIYWFSIKGVQLERNATSIVAPAKDIPEEPAPPAKKNTSGQNAPAKNISANGPSATPSAPPSAPSLPGLPCGSVFLLGFAFAAIIASRQ